MPHHLFHFIQQVYRLHFLLTIRRNDLSQVIKLFNFQFLLCSVLLSCSCSSEVPHPFISSPSFAFSLTWKPSEFFRFSPRVGCQSGVIRQKKIYNEALHSICPHNSAFPFMQFACFGSLARASQYSRCLLV